MIIIHLDTEFFIEQGERLSYILYFVYFAFILLTIVGIAYTYKKNKKALPSLFGILLIGHIGALYVIDFGQLFNINFSIMLGTYEYLFYLLLVFTAIGIAFTAILYSTGLINRAKDE